MEAHCKGRMISVWFYECHVFVLWVKNHLSSYPIFGLQVAIVGLQILTQ